MGIVSIYIKEFVLNTIILPKIFMIEYIHYFLIYLKHIDILYGLLFTITLVVIFYELEVFNIMFHFLLY